ncbi:MAG: relaxase/mobilization nuclease domain-containing protein [Lachnospiraceae bacterium]|nr:relaxase/mobilization nuclease domain-containing protein [Lachnospiraceae bacterium]
MAIIEAISARSPVGNAIDYIQQDKKTEWKISGGFNCNPETAKQEMQLTKELWNKKGGRTYFHFIQSFAPGEKLDLETAHALAREFVEQLPLFFGYEVAYATHKDRRHIHTHFIVNSVNAVDGHKLHMSKKDLQGMKDFSDELCRAYGLSITVKGKSYEGAEREETTAHRKDTFRLLQKAEKRQIDSYVQNIALAVMDAREEALNRQDFISIMYQKGYLVAWSEQRKYIVFEDKARKKKGEKKYKIQNKKLEEYYHIDFGKEQLEHEFANNARRAERESADYRGEQQYYVFGEGEQSHIGADESDDQSGKTDSGKQSSEGSLDQISRQLREITDSITGDRDKTAEAGQGTGKTDRRVENSQYGVGKGTQPHSKSI